LLTLWLAADSPESLASYQIAATVWTLLSLILDSLAIAGQPLIARGLGAGDLDLVRKVAGTLLRWGGLVGGLLAVLVFASHRVIPLAFTAETLIRQNVSESLIVLAALLPLAGLVFVLDGVLIAAGDGRWLAAASLAHLAAYTPIVVFARMFPLTPSQLWGAFGMFLVFRGATLLHRYRSDRWLSPSHGAESIGRQTRRPMDERWD
ncbi:MAG: MATE family efflux transporter, partial [Angustibacter sp.]